MTAAGGEAERPATTTSERRLWALAALGYIAIALLLLGQFIFGSSSNRIASSELGDGVRYFAFVREFVAAELASGNVPLWNPHSFSGTPLVGAFQPAVFYPPTLVYLLLPLALSFNIELALHVGLLGFATFAWLRGWRLHPAACFFGGCVAALSGASFLRVLAGQLSVLDTLAWSPLVLLAIDRVAERRSLGGVLVGAAAVTLMILAGHPPTVFMCAIVIGLYCLPPLLASRERGRLLLSLALIVIAPLGLSAVQLWTGLEVAGHGLRAGGMPVEFSTSFSLPPENLLTLIAPDMLGGGRFGPRPYFGRWVHWDSSAYLGVVALALALYGAATGRSPLRARASVLCVVAFVLSLGGATPLYGWLYDWVPGFDQMRAPSKFVFLLSLFAAALSAIGLDRLLREPGRERGSERGALIAVGLLAGIAAVLLVWAWGWPPGDRAGISLPVLLGRMNDQRSFLPLHLHRWNGMLVDTLRVSLALLVAAGVLIHLAPRYRWAIPALIVVGIAELLVFAHGHRGGASIHTESFQRPGLRAAYERAEGDRVLLVGRTSNVALRARGLDLWGYDAVMLGRYVEFMARSQGRSPDQLNNIGGEHPDAFHPLFAMLRGRFSLDRSAKRVEHPGAWPRFTLARGYHLAADAEAALDQIFVPGFDPHTPVLESPPRPVPDSNGSGGSVELIGESTDHLDLAVELESPAILLIGDAYAPGWRVRDFETGRVGAYSVQPANSVMRAIALPAGEHRLRVEYMPTGYRLGRWVTALSVALFAAAVVFWARSRRVVVV